MYTRSIAMSCKDERDDEKRACGSDEYFTLGKVKYLANLRQTLSYLALAFRLFYGVKNF